MLNISCLFGIKICRKMYKIQWQCNMIDFELYRIFVAVANAEKITRASTKLNISQPAVIKKLKNQLSLKLFDRKNKGLSLTIEEKCYMKNLRIRLENLIE